MSCRRRCFPNTVCRRPAEPPTPAPAAAGMPGNHMNGVSRRDTCGIANQALTTRGLHMPSVFTTAGNMEAVGITRRGPNLSVRAGKSHRRGEGLAFYTGSGHRAGDGPGVRRLHRGPWRRRQNAPERSSVTFFHLSSPNSVCISVQWPLRCNSTKPHRRASLALQTVILPPDLFFSLIIHSNAPLHFLCVVGGKSLYS